MTDRNIACKTCGTKVFKIQEEVEAHHKEAHPEVEGQSAFESPEQGDKDTQA